MEELLDTDRFDFMRAYNSAAWIEAMEHPEEHDDPEVLEYDIETFVYSRRKPFDRRSSPILLSRVARRGHSRQGSAVADRQSGHVLHV